MHKIVVQKWDENKCRNMHVHANPSVELEPQPLPNKNVSQALHVSRPCDAEAFRSMVSIIPVHPKHL